MAEGAVRSGLAEDAHHPGQCGFSSSTHVQGFHRQPHGVDADHRNNSRSQAAHSPAAETGQSTFTTIPPRRSSIEISGPAPLLGRSTAMGTNLGLSIVVGIRAFTENSGTGLLSFTDVGEKSDPSLVVDLRVTQPIRSGVEAYVDFQNLTSEDAVDSYAIRGFAFYVGVRADFDWAGSIP